MTLRIEKVSVGVENSRSSPNKSNPISSCFPLEFPRIFPSTSAILISPHVPRFQRELSEPFPPNHIPQDHVPLFSVKGSAASLALKDSLTFCRCFSFALFTRISSCLFSFRKSESADISRFSVENVNLLSSFVDLT
jgi:hypothetical protein